VLTDGLVAWTQELEAEVLALLQDRVGVLGYELGLDKGEALELLLNQPVDDTILVLVSKLR
jgi:hypothetical protein